jgi:hypothetical protein
MTPFEITNQAPPIEPRVFWRKLSKNQQNRKSENLTLELFKNQLYECRN